MAKMMKFDLECGRRDGFYGDSIDFAGPLPADALPGDDRLIPLLDADLNASGAKVERLNRTGFAGGSNS